MFRTRLRYEYFGNDCAFTRKLAKPISIFLFRTSGTLLGREHKLLVSFNIANLFLTLRILCIVFYSIQNIDVGVNEIGLELILGYYVSIDSLDERNTGVVCRH